MKNLIYVGAGLVVGIIVGIAASFKAAEKKADDKVTEILAKERKAMREASEEKTEEVKETKSEEPAVVDFSEEVKEEDVMDEYKPAKPYVLEGMGAGWKEAHPYIDDFEECCVVYDKKRGRVADDNGCEIFDIKGCLGFNNLNRIAEKAVVHIVCERDAVVYITHVGSLEEFMDDIDADED